MGQPSYMRSVVDRNVVMRRMIALQRQHCGVQKVNTAQTYSWSTHALFAVPQTPQALSHHAALKIHHNAHTPHTHTHTHTHHTHTHTHSVALLYSIRTMTRRLATSLAL